MHKIDSLNYFKYLWEKIVSNTIFNRFCIVSLKKEIPTDFFCYRLRVTLLKKYVIMSWSISLQPLSLPSLLIFPRSIFKNLLTCFLSSTNVSSLYYYFPVIIFYIFLFNHCMCHLSQGNLNDLNKQTLFCHHINDIILKISLIFTI